MDESQAERKAEEKDGWTRAKRSRKQREKANGREPSGAECRKRRLQSERKKANSHTADRKQ